MKQKRIVEIVLVTIGFLLLIGAFLFGGGWCREFLPIFSNSKVVATHDDQVANPLDDLIRVTSPKENDLVSSSILIRGEARGYWFFEASFPITVLDANGNELYRGPVQAKGEWMTEDFVPFETKVTIKEPTTKTGVIIFHRDNPSGLPEYEQEIRIPVRF
ncbi:MAG: Gmad2 immunoglobulin-like domain-containing protein [Candidatus Uhrbacteria bacterium]|nr:Gmad2 immunoglobulin-like domain-containing protein [bacterium]MCR4314646.1 Gmad2 immunoglobulin-like domain-containing protein [Candidatus Uhrbacteria bacterium]